MASMLRAAWVGMQLRCPACGEGRISRGLTTMNQSCPQCGVTFERDEGDFLGAMVVAYSITSVLVGVGIYVVAVTTDLPVTGHLILWTVFAGLFLLLTYRNMKGIWLGILHGMVGLRRP